MSNKRDEDTIQTESNNQIDMERLSQMREWIVKSNMVISGPFSSEEVSQGLRDKRFVAHDEIISPRGRWKYLRQEEKFRSVINEVKNRQSALEKNSEDTADTSVTASAKFRMPASFDNTSALMEGVEARGPSTDNIHPALSRDLAKSYGYEKDLRVQSQNAKSETVKVVAALVVFVLAAGFYFTRLSPRLDNAGNHIDTFQSMLNQGIVAEKVGDYTKAMAFYSDARNVKPNDPELLYRIAPLTFTFEKQSLQSGRIFKQILDTDANPEHKQSALIGLGLVALEAHEFDVALENFDKVMKNEPDQTAAVFNIGLINYYKDKFSEAEAFLSRALAKSGNDGTIVMAMADVIVATSQESGGRLKLGPAHDMMKVYLEVAFDYRAQVLIEDAYVQALAGKTGEANQLLEQALDVDPEQTDLFLRDWRFYRERSGWEQTLFTLKKVLPLIPASSHMSALKGLAMFEGREKLEGSKEIEKALAESPRDPLLLSIAGWTEMKLGHRQDAIVNIKEAALGESKYRLPKVLQARLCAEEKNFDCAQKFWEKINAQDPKNLAAYAGLAEIAWEKKDTASTIRWLRQGQALDAKYIPFNILSAAIETSETGK